MDNFKSMENALAEGLGNWLNDMEARHERRKIINQCLHISVIPPLTRSNFNDNDAKNLRNSNTEE